MLIDTDLARKELEGGGFTNEQTEAQLNIVRMLDEQAREQLATKADIENLRSSMYRTVWSGMALLAALMTLFNYL